MRYIVYTDGSSRGEVGTCSYVVVSKQEVIHSKAFRYYNTTNNKMELEGVYQALKYINSTIGPKVEVVIFTDSTYVRDGLTNWIKKWLSNGWRTANGGDVLNKEEWVKLYNIYSSMNNIELKWCKGHSDNKFNNIADKLCTEAYKKTVKEPKTEEEFGKQVTLATMKSLSKDLVETETLLLAVYREMWKEAFHIGSHGLRVNITEYLIKKQLIENSPKEIEI